MYATQTQTNPQEQGPSEFKDCTLNVPAPVISALIHFVNFNPDAEDVKRTLYDQFHMALGSDQFDSILPLDRSEQFFVIRELCHLVDVLYSKNHNFIETLKKLQP